MKRFLLASGTRIKRIAQAGKRKYRKLLGHPVAAGEQKQELEEGEGKAIERVVQGESLATLRAAAGSGESKKYRTPEKPKANT